MRACVNKVNVLGWNKSLINMKPATNQVVNIPNNEVMTSSFKVKILAYSVLSKKAQYSHMFKYIHSEYLKYLGYLCDDGYTDILDRRLIHVVKGTHLVLSGKRNQMDVMWDIPLTFPVLSPSTVQ